MYHRYLRNEQGQYRRQTVPDPPAEKPSLPQTIPLMPTPPPRQDFPPPPPRQDFPPPPPRLRDNDHAPPPNFQLPFLSRLFPNMDAGDLLLLMILLLLLSEGNEDASSMAMTLAIFLFLQ